MAKCMNNNFVGFNHGCNYDYYNCKEKLYNQIYSQNYSSARSSSDYYSSVESEVDPLYDCALNNSLEYTLDYSSSDSLDYSSNYSSDSSFKESKTIMKKEVETEKIDGFIITKRYQKEKKAREELKEELLRRKELLINDYLRMFFE